MKYKIGQLVVNTKLGLGKVLEIRGDNVTVFFKDQTENPRIINVGVLPMEIPAEQSDESLDDPDFMKRRARRATGAKRAKRPAVAKAL